MYIFTVFTAIVYRVSWLTKVDLFNSRYLRSPTLSYGTAVHSELGPPYASSFHNLQTERKFVALVGFLLAEMLAEYRQMDRQGVQKTTGACLAAPNSKQAW
jgi:hypothetical protein